MEYSAARVRTTAIVSLLLLLALSLAWPGAAPTQESKCPFAGKRPPLDDILKGLPSPRPSFCKANLAGTNLTGANLAGIDLTGANLKGINLAKANLTRTNLAGADLAGSYLGKANLNGTHLAGADLGGTKRTEARADSRGLHGLGHPTGQRGDERFDLQERLVADRVALPIIFITALDDDSTRPVRSGWVPIKTVLRSGSTRPYTEGNLLSLTCPAASVDRGHAGLSSYLRLDLAEEDSQ